MPVRDRIPRIAERALSGARRAGTLGIDAARDLADGVRRRRQAQDQNASASATAEQPAPPAEARAAEPSAPEQPPPPAEARAAEPSAAQQPEHVDRDAVVVAESADPGTSDSVGAQVTIDEPWEGYGELDAEQVVAQLDEANSETLAIVRLYEQMHGNRGDVIDTIDRRLAEMSS